MSSRPRYILTESDEVADALDDAAEHWPQDRDARGKLLVNLVNEGRRAILESRAERISKRRKAIKSSSGALTGAYGPRYLERIRGERSE